MWFLRKRDRWIFWDNIGLPIVDGTVGSGGDFERCFCASARALMISWLSGSTWRPNLKFAVVYSCPQYTFWKAFLHFINLYDHFKGKYFGEEKRKWTVKKLTVSPGRAPSIVLRDVFIWSALPSKNLPQPPMKRVSPIRLHWNMNG